MGKSAQAPLHVWLPDAMEGPTPVSALIHAATMVAAGVYMLCRVFFLIEGTWAMEAIAWIGGLTSLLAALMAVQQDDIKRILAYSTLSQFGLHGDGGWAGFARRGDVSPYDARLLQGAAVPRGWLGDRGAASRAGHLENGRPARADAQDVLDVF